jgi:hypothetical protein
MAGRMQHTLLSSPGLIRECPVRYGLVILGRNFDVIPEIDLAIIRNPFRSLCELRHGSRISRASASFRDDAVEIASELTRTAAGLIGRSRAKAKNFNMLMNGRVKSGHDSGKVCYFSHALEGLEIG